jgi:hypothetical protein
LDRLRIFSTAGCLALISYAANWTYSGRVTDSHGRPVAHAVVLASSMERRTAAGPPEGILVTTDADEAGNFTFTVPEKGRYFSANDARLKRYGELPDPSPGNANVIVIR